MLFVSFTKGPKGLPYAYGTALVGHWVIIPFAPKVFTMPTFHTFLAGVKYVHR